MVFLRFFSLCLLTFSLTNCSQKIDKAELTELLEKNPEILKNAIEKNSKALVPAFTKVTIARREAAFKKRQELRRAQMEKYFKEPLTPTLDETHSFQGAESAKITVVEYADFQCYFCAKGHQTLKDLLETYPKDLRITVKHLPLPKHKHAKLGAQYFEAIREQSEEAAWKFRDTIFENQRALREKGPALFEETVKSLSIDRKKLKKALNSKKIAKKLEADQEEAKSFGLRATPAYVINGVLIQGALPKTEFAWVIDRHLGKVPAPKTETPKVGD